MQLRSDCTLDVTYSSEGMVFAGQDIKLWYIADITEDTQYALAGSFRSYPIQVTGTSSQSEWDEMAITLNSYILADGIAADQSAKTDARGKVVFDNLTAGIYLISSVRTEQDGKYYVFESFLAAVPGVDSEGQWVYSVSARPKMSVHTPAKGEVTYKAVKAWRDGGQDRPVSVSVEVRRDGQLQQTVALSAENNWMYTWKAVDDGSVWTVNEVNVPEGYVEIDGNDVIGLLELPGRGIKLPVSAEWDSSEQSFRPARFMGSVYDGTLIVGGRSADGNFDFIDQLDAGEELTFTDMTGRVFRYTVHKIRHADNARAETLADSESALTLFVKKMELFSSSDVQRHSILLNRRCRTAPVDNGKLRRPTRCRYDSLFNFLFITHEGPPLQIAALPGGRWPGAAHLIPGKTKLKYLYLCIPC